MAKFLIIDDNGVIHSGSHEEMEIAFAVMNNDVDFFETKKSFKEAVKQYQTSWSGDLKLVEVIKISR